MPSGRADAAGGESGGRAGRRAYHAIVWGIGIFVLAAIAGWIAREFPAATFEHNAVGTALEVLGSLSIVALFVERAQQVYICVWRGMDRRALDGTLAEAQVELAATKAAIADDATPEAKRQDKQHELPVLEEAVLAARLEVDDFRAETKKMALIGGMLLGVLIALVGPRLLDAIVVLPAGTGPVQAGLFDALDVLITGGLIGGGSEGIHQLVGLVTDFLEESRTRVRGESGVAGEIVEQQTGRRR